MISVKLLNKKEIPLKMLRYKDRTYMSEKADNFQWKNSERPLESLQNYCSRPLLKNYKKV